MRSKSWRNVIDSERGFTFLEIMVTLVIVCMFTIVITQFMGLSFKDIFNKGNKMQATASAQNLMEKVTAVAENSPAADLDNSLRDLEENVDEDNLLLYDPAIPARFYYDTSDPKEISNTDDVEGIDVSVVVFYNNGASYVRIDNFIKTG